MLLKPDGSGAFESVTLRPNVTIAPGGDEKRAFDLHETAHDMCFIAASVSIPVLHEARIRIAGAEATETKATQKSTESEVRP